MKRKPPAKPKAPPEDPIPPDPGEANVPDDGDVWWAGLNDRQRRFVEEYCVDFNATKAAIRAGYSENAAAEIGWRLLRNAQIKAAVEARLDELTLSTAEAMRRLTEMATADIADALEVQQIGDELDPDGPVAETVRLSLAKIIRTGRSHLVKAITFTKAGPRIEMHDAQAALDKILRVRGAYRDRLEVTTDQVIGLEIVEPAQPDAAE